MPGVLVLCLLAATPFAASRAEEPMFDIDIPSMNAAEALNRLAEQTGSVMLFSYDLARARQANAVRGRYTLPEGLELLLQDTGLSGGLSEKRVVIIAEVRNMPAGKGESVKKRGLWAGIMAGLVASAPAGVRADQNPKTETLEEIVVIAQKRSERLLEVPVPVTVIRADALVASNQFRLEEYYSQVPGLTLTVSDGRGVPMISIRGITSGYTNPTVGVVVDGAPFGSSTNLALGALVPDIDPSELARVEVLRGPQGSLYGASSMGGLLNYVTIAPSFDGVSGRLQSGTSSVHEGKELGYNLSAAVNVPLSDTFAIRASGFNRRDPGYVDNPRRGEEDVNSGYFTGGRLSGLWQPSEDISLTLSALYQDSSTDGLARVDAEPGFKDLEQDNLRGSGFLDKTVAAFTANLVANLGDVELTSVSGYNINRFSDSIDLIPFHGLTEPIFGVSGAPLLDDIETTKFTQELRFAIPIGERVEWMIGGFYTHENSNTTQLLLAQDEDTLEVVEVLYDGVGRSTYDELSAFSNLTIQITDRLDVQFGGRQSRIEQETWGHFGGWLVGGGPFEDDRLKATNDAFTYLVTPRLKVSPDLMVYARAASGYRAGLPNGNLVAGAPPSSKPDKTATYEIGVKGVALNRMLTFDASLYHIDWTDMQILVFNELNIGYFTNGGDAKSEGLELSVESTPAEGLTIAGWVSWGNAELTEAFPPGSQNFGAVGDRLPYSSRFSGNLTVRKEFPIASRMTGFVGGQLSYVGDRVGYFQATPVRQKYAAYTKADLLAGVMNGPWTFNLFVNNVTDERAALAGGLDGTPTTSFTHIVPRTVGLNASYDW